MALWPSLLAAQVSVPTQQDFDALKARVTALEQAQPTPTPTPTPTPPPSTVVPVSTFAALQQAIDTQPGAEIRLALNVRFAGHLILRQKPCTPVTTITTDGPIPAAGVRVGLTDPLALIVSPDFDDAIKTEPGACGYRLLGVEVGPQQGGYASIAIGTNTETALSQYPCDITIDRVRIVGTATSQQRRGIMANGCRLSIVNSYIAGIKFVGEDAQALWLNGPCAPCQVANNYLDASGENLMIGGADPKLLNLVPSGIAITGNLLRKNPALRNGPYSVKNILEIKNARAVVITGNVLEHVWVASQTGYAVLFTPRNQSGTCPWCIVENVTFERNVVRHMAGAVNIIGIDDEQPSQTATDLRIRNNLFVDYGQAWGNGYAIQMGAGVKNVTLDHNTFVSGTGGSRGFILAYGAPMPGLTLTNNVAPHDLYGILGNGVGTGTPAIAMYFPGAVIAKNVLAGGTASQYPAGTLTPSMTTFLAQFVNPAGGDYALVMASSWKGAGTDGQDLGAQVAALPNGGR